MAASVVLSIGSNCRYEEVGLAINWLRGRLDGCRVSHEYLTPALQGYGAPYTNAVVSGLTGLGYDALEASLKAYERARGRDETARQRGGVPVDIDIVVWNGEVTRPRDFRHDFFQIGYKVIINDY